MCDECTERARVRDIGYDNAKQATTSSIGRGESHIIYQLKQKREYILQQLVDVQNAITAVNKSE